MSDTIGNILNYTPEPNPEVHLRQKRMLWIAAAVSLSMAAVGYLILALIIL